MQINALASLVFGHSDPFPAEPRELLLPFSDNAFTLRVSRSYSDPRLDPSTLGGSLVLQADQLASALFSGAWAHLTFEGGQARAITLGARMALIPFRYSDSTAARAAERTSFEAVVRHAGAHVQALCDARLPVAAIEGYQRGQGRCLDGLEDMLEENTPLRRRR